MEFFTTEYGVLSDLANYTLYENGTLKDCTTNKANIIKTKYGDLIPQYDYIDVRRKYIKSISFFPDGKLSRISLNEQTPIETSIGIIRVELITFYPSGNINRIFPLNGQLSGYWDEEQEYDLTKDIDFSFPFGNFVSRATGIYFYDNGHVKGLSLWTNEIIEINTPIGNQSVRLGLSLYENGTIKAFEPSSPLSVLSPIGHILAFDANDYLFFKECKSVNFYENSAIESIMTSKSKIVVVDRDKNIHVYEPRCCDNFDDGDFYIYPLKVSFLNNTVFFNDLDSFKIDECTFTIDKQLDLHSSPQCTHNCSTCGAACSTSSISIV